MPPNPQTCDYNNYTKYMLNCSSIVQIKSHMVDPFQSGCRGQMRGPQVHQTMLELEEEVEELGG